eukprot:tig00020531_g10062.t1
MASSAFLGLFRSDRKRTPPELVAALKSAVEAISKKADPKGSDEVSKALTAIKTALLGDGESAPSVEIVSQLAAELHRDNLILDLIENLSYFGFEARKDVAQIFNSLLRRHSQGSVSWADYVLRSPGERRILAMLVDGYNNQDIALNCGSMLRECIRSEQMCRALLEPELMYKFFHFVEITAFDVASDAFATFKELLTKHKTLIAKYLEDNFEEFFNAYTGLLNSQNYVTRRQSLKLLGELLLDRANFSVMTRFIGNVDNLKLMMILLRDKSKSIQFEAFHVFKIFVANPNKTQPIRDILCKNRSKLLVFLQSFQQDKEDEQFNEEKELLLKEIQKLPEVAE